MNVAAQQEGALVTRNLAFGDAGKHPGCSRCARWRLRCRASSSLARGGGSSCWSHGRHRPTDPLPAVIGSSGSDSWSSRSRAVIGERLVAALAVWVHLTGHGVAPRVEGGLGHGGGSCAGRLMSAGRSQTLRVSTTTKSRSTSTCALRTSVALGLHASGKRGDGGWHSWGRLGESRRDASVHSVVQCFVRVDDLGELAVQRCGDRARGLAGRERVSSRSGSRGTCLWRRGRSGRGSRGRMPRARWSRSSGRWRCHRRSRRRRRGSSKPRWRSTTMSASCEVSFTRCPPCASGGRARGSLA